MGEELPEKYSTDPSINTEEFSCEFFCPTQYVAYGEDKKVAQIAYPIVPRDKKFILDCDASGLEYEIFFKEDEITMQVFSSQLHKIHKTPPETESHGAMKCQSQHANSATSHLHTVHERWLKQTKADMDMADAVFKTKKEARYALTCFLSQQVAEKALKSRIVPHEAYWKTHKIEQLKSMIPTNEIDWPDNLETLSKYYTETRYPDAQKKGVPFECYSQEEAKKAMDVAECILNIIISLGE